MRFREGGNPVTKAASRNDFRGYWIAGSSPAMTRNRERECSVAVDEALDALMLGAMDAAIDGVVVLHAMADDAAATMRAERRERGDGAFEAVEDMGAAAHGDFEAPVVIIAALRAFAHGVLLLSLFGRGKGGSLSVPVARDPCAYKVITS
jgi:hypothetical protein